MTALCPKGHQSEAGDYCDVCGARIGAPAAVEAASSAAGPAAVERVASAAGPAGPGGGEGVAAAGPPCSACGTVNPVGTRFCEDCGASLTSPAAAPAPAPSSPGAPGEPAAWEAVASADREYFERMDGEGIAWPAVHVERRFVLRGQRMTIGRRSVSKGIEPDIDLSAAPEDIGVSHQHAVLLAGDDGAWSVVDPGSTNGTYLNEGTDPLEVGSAVALHDGDRIHVGAWTTITVRQVG